MQIRASVCRTNKGTTNASSKQRQQSTSTSAFWLPTLAMPFFVFQKLKKDSRQFNFFGIVLKTYLRQCRIIPIRLEHVTSRLLRSNHVSILSKSSLAITALAITYANKLEATRAQKRLMFV